MTKAEYFTIEIVTWTVIISKFNSPLLNHSAGYGGMINYVRQLTTSIQLFQIESGVRVLFLSPFCNIGLGLCMVSTWQWHRI